VNQTDWPLPANQPNQAYLQHGDGARPRAQPPVHQALDGAEEHRCTLLCAIANDAFEWIAVNRFGLCHLLPTPYLAMNRPKDEVKDRRGGPVSRGLDG
jgi:hypothetical protein